MNYFDVQLKPIMINLIFFFFFIFKELDERFEQRENELFLVNTCNSSLYKKEQIFVKKKKANI